MVDFFNKKEEKRIIAAIKNAELNTSGEIRIHLEPALKDISTLDAAANVFRDLKMDATAARNGVLFFIVPQQQQFAIIGDKGINEKVPPHFWEDIRDILQTHFKKSEFAEGLVQGINRVGEKLKAFFPYQTDDQNELPDDISYGS